MNSNDDTPPIDALRDAWRDVDSDLESDPTAFVVVTRLRDAWNALPIPPARLAFAPRRRFGARYAIAAALLCALTLGFASIEHAPQRATPKSSPSSLALEIALLTPWSSATALLVPCFLCLGCELLMTPPADTAGQLPPNEHDHRLADALRADCRGDWSGTVVILEPLLESASLTPEQRTRATVALARAYQQLGHSDRALALAAIHDSATR